MHFHPPTDSNAKVELNIIERTFSNINRMKTDQLTFVIANYFSKRFDKKTHRLSLVLFLVLFPHIHANAVTEHDIELPIVSITINPDSFAIIQNTLSKEYEPTCKIIFIENGDTLLKQDIRIQIAGSGSKWGHVKSYEIKADKTIGEKNIPNLFFDNGVEKYKSLKLRNVASLYHRRNPNFTGLANNVFISLFGRNSMSKIDYQETRQIVLFINERYYGIYDLTETTNLNYLKSKYDYKKEDLNYCKLGTIGNTIDWVFKTENDSIEYTTLKELIDSPQSSYEDLANVMDIDNLIDYYLIEIFAENADWPTNNCIIWKKKKNDKWKFIINDFDWSGLNPRASNIGILLSEKQKEIFVKATFQKLSNNIEFRKKVCDRLLIACGTYFGGDNFHAYVDSVAENVRYEIPFQSEFYKELCEMDNETYEEEYHYYDNWEESVESLSNWSYDRKEPIQNMLKGYIWEENDYADLKIESDVPYFMNEEPVKGNFKGYYFKNRKMSFTYQDGNPCICEVITYSPKEGITKYMAEEGTVTLNEEVIDAQITILDNGHNGLLDIRQSADLPTNNIYDINGREISNPRNNEVLIKNGKKVIYSK